jgi:hypothetical protein
MRCFIFVGAFNSGRDLIHGRRAESVDVNVGSKSPKIVRSRIEAIASFDRTTRERERAASVAQLNTVTCFRRHKRAA